MFKKLHCLNLQHYRFKHQYFKYQHKTKIRYIAFGFMRMVGFCMNYYVIVHWNIITNYNGKNKNIDTSKNILILY